MKIAVYGGSRLFFDFLSSASRGGAIRFDDLTEAAAYVKDHAADALFILPFYDRGEYSIPEFSDETAQTVAAVIRGGETKIYIENYPSYDFRDCFAFGLQARGLISNIGKNSVCLAGAFREKLGFDILQKRGGFFFVNDVHTDSKYEVLAEIKNCFGVNKIVDCAEKREGVALLKVGENVYCSMADLTNIDPPAIFSYENWQSFYARLVCELTGADFTRAREVFRKIYEPIGIFRSVRSKERKTALENAVKEAISWHKNSGVMPGGGKNGVYEMIRSFDLKPAKNLRGDSSLFTAALFMAAGRYFGDDDACRTAERIADYMLCERKLQIESGANAGLFKWFSGFYDVGTQSVYVSDTSRVANSVFALYRFTGKEEYKKRILLCGEAILKWFGGEALLPGCYFRCDADDLASLQDRERGACPEFYDAPLLFLRNLYSVNKDKRYKEQILKTAKKLAEIYPNYRTATSHSDNFTYSRLLCVFAVAESFESGPWTPLINELLAYFDNVRHDSGGFADSRAYYDGKSLDKDMEFAVGFENDDRIADIVYCQNTMLYTLYILLSNKNRGGSYVPLAEKLFDGLVEFLLDTQIRSDDKRLHGAWMRAFDMDKSEYYGCDKDFLWGPYCILTGWVTGAIPLVFLSMLGEVAVY